MNTPQTMLPAVLEHSDKKFGVTTELYLNIFYIFNTFTFLDTISMHSTFHKAYKNPKFPSPCLKQMQRILALSVLQWCYKRQKHSMLKYTIKDLTWLWCDLTFVGNILNRLSLLFHASFWIVHFPSAQTINFLLIGCHYWFKQVCIVWPQTVPWLPQL